LCEKREDKSVGAGTSAQKDWSTSTRARSEGTNGVAAAGARAWEYSSDWFPKDLCLGDAEQQQHKRFVAANDTPWIVHRNQATDVAIPVIEPKQTNKRKKEEKKNNQIRTKMKQTNKQTKKRRKNNQIRTKMKQTNKQTNKQTDRQTNKNKICMKHCCSRFPRVHEEGKWQQENIVTRSFDDLARPTHSSKGD
jgi:hypothetical protein